VHKNLYLAGAAVAVALITAALVIIIARPSPPAAGAPPARTTAAATPAATNSTVTTATPTSPPTPAPQAGISARPAHARIVVPALPAARQSDAMAVAMAVVATLYSVDPAVDSDRTDAARRAAYLLTPTCAATLTAPPTTGAGVQWQQWVSADAYITVTSKKINIPWTVADNRLTVIRNIGFTQSVHTQAGTTALPQQTLALRLVRAADGRPWRVNSMETP